MSRSRNENIKIESATDYADYMKNNHARPITEEGQAIIDDVTFALDQHQGSAAYNLRDLSDEEKGQAIGAILTSNPQTIVDTIGPHLRLYDANDDVKQLMNPPKDASEWVNNVCKRLITTMLQKNGEEYEDPPINLPPEKMQAIMQIAFTRAAAENINFSEVAIERLSTAINEKPADLYVKYVNRNYNKKENDQVNLTAVTQIRETINKELNNEHSDLSTHLARLPESDKISIMSALISNDRDAISNFLSSTPVTFPAEVKSELKNVGFFLPGEDSNFMNDTTRTITQQLLNGQGGQPLGIESAHKIITNAMNQIHDTEIDLRTKLSIAKTIDPDVKTLFVGYNEYVQPLEAGKTNGSISLKEYEASTSGNQADYSQFIMLSLGALQTASATNPTLDTALQKIRNDYMNVKYENAIDTLKYVCTELSSSGQTDEAAKISALILDRSKGLSPDKNEVNIEKNYSRRFLENRVAALQFGNIDNFDSINKVGKYFGESDFQEVKDTASAIRELTALPEHGDNAIMQRKEALTKQYSGDYSKKGRHLKDDFYAQENEPSLDPNKYIDSLYSQNPGVMKSYQPNYRDELTSKSLRNPQPDVNTYTNSSEFYPLKYNRSAYVASISGHTYYMVAMLEKYMKDNPGPELNHDMNSFMKSFVATYIGRGYHSYLECAHVLQEPAVIELFAQNGVKLDADLPDNILREAFKDAQSYTKTTALSQAVRTEMKGTISDFMKAVKNGKSREVRELISNNDKVRQMCHEHGETLVGIAKEAGNRQVIDAIVNVDKVAKIAETYQQTDAQPTNQSPVDIIKIKEIRMETQDALDMDVISARIRGMDQDDKILSVAALVSHDVTAIKESIGPRIGIYENTDIELLVASLPDEPNSLMNPICHRIVDQLLQTNDDDANAVTMPKESIHAMLAKAMDIAQGLNHNISTQERNNFIETKISGTGYGTENKANNTIENEGPEPTRLKM